MFFPERDSSTALLWPLYEDPQRSLSANSSSQENPPILAILENGGYWVRTWDLDSEGPRVFPVFLFSQRELFTATQ